MTPAQLKELERGKPYRVIANRLGVDVATIVRQCLKMGKPNGWKRQMAQDRRQKELLDVTQALCVVPNLRRVCKEKGISYHGFIRKNDFRAKNIGCYVAARNKCRICGVDITDRTWWRRLCKAHDMLVQKRQLELRINRGVARKTRRPHYFIENRIP